MMYWKDAGQRVDRWNILKNNIHRNQRIHYGEVIANKADVLLWAGKFFKFRYDQKYFTRPKKALCTFTKASVLI